MTASQPETFESLVIASAPSLLRLAMVLTGNSHDADDLLQSALAKATRHADKIAAMAAPRAYLRRIVVNEHTSRGRRRRDVPVAEVPDAAADDVGARNQEERDAVWALLSELSTAQRAVLVLRYYEDLPDREIAELLGCREATVRSHALRAMTALRTRLAEGGDR